MIWLQMAWRDLRRNVRRTCFALGVIAVGSAAAIAAAGYMVSTFTAVRESTIRGGVGHLQVATPAEFAGYEERVLENALSGEDLARIRRETQAMANVEFVLPRLAFQGIASSGERTLVVLGEGIEPREERRLSAHFVPIVAGEGLESRADAERYGALIGREMARVLGVGPRDLITLLAISAAGGLNAVDAEVVGVIASGTPELDRMRLLVPLRLAQDLLQSDRVRRVVLVLDDTSATNGVRRELARRLPELAVKSWRELSPFYGQLVGLYARQAAVLGAVIAAIVLLAAFSTVAMGVMERRRDIGTLLSLGIPAARVRRIFLTEGALLGGLGGAAGAAVALCLTGAVNSSGVMMPPPPGQTESYPLLIAFEPRIAALVAVTLGMLGLTAGWLASLHVTRQNIVAAMSRV